jgi:hypothetical protein
MGNLTLTYLPPQNWQDFEKFLKGVVDVIWKQEGWQNYGRAGQDQAGIDLYGYDEQRRFTAIQCKKKSLTNAKGKLLTTSLLTKKLIETEIISAEKVSQPQIERLIFATTSSRDTKVQDDIRAINDERKKNSKFFIEVWFWEDFQVLIENNIELMYWYYSELLDSVHKYDKNIHILSMLRQAFNRPAFSREIRQEESGGDFIQAIKNTMEAVTTGKLYNRRGDLIATSYDYKKITNPNWRESILKIYNSLDQIRKIYSQGVIDKSIREHQTCLEVLDDRISDKFNIIRTECLIEMNKILTELKLEKIDSELIRH